MDNHQVCKERKTSLGNAIIIGVVMLAVGIIIGVNAGRWFEDFAPYLGISSSVAGDWSELNEVYGKLVAEYNGSIDKDKLIEGAKEGMVDALGDQYTVYMNSEKSADFYNDLHGAVGSGVGIEMGVRDGYVRVLRTLPDNPARKAGVLAGDIIFKVNGEEVWELGSDEIANRVRGEDGTEVTLTVVRDGKELDYTMKREKINNVSAYVEFDDGAAIVTITRFDNDTGQKVREMVKDFDKRGVSKVILDLRNNGGGYVSAARDLLSLWLDGEKFLIQKSRRSGDSADSTLTGRAVLGDMKTVVLVNGSTASASEIVAAALRDYGKATILGEKTYGKGSVQNLFELSDGATLKVTTAEWYTPKERSINLVGIEPDVVVEMSYDDINSMRDPQMDRAKNL